MSRPIAGQAMSACAGLALGSLAWAINTQLGQILSYVDCQSHLRYSALVSFAGAAAAGITGLLSWRSVNGRDPSALDGASTLRFVGSVSALAAFLFTYALAMQGVASLVLSGCER